MDTVVLPDSLFQMTISMTHGIKEGGLDALKLPDGLKINFYFVTPIECIENFKKAKLGDTWSGRIQQRNKITK